MFSCSRKSLSSTLSLFTVRHQWCHMASSSYPIIAVSSAPSIFLFFSISLPFSHTAGASWIADWLTEMKNSTLFVLLQLTTKLRKKCKASLSEPSLPIAHTTSLLLPPSVTLLSLVTCQTLWWFSCQTDPIAQVCARGQMICKVIKQWIRVRTGMYNPEITFYFTFKSQCKTSSMLM